MLVCTQFFQIKKGGTLTDLAVKGKLNSVNDVNRSFFSWLVRPIVLALWPRRETWLVKNLANIISTLRLLVSLATIVFLVYPAYVNQNDARLYASLALMLVLLLTDGIDGALARGLDCVSRYGKAIDPLADKVFYLASVVAAVLGAWHLIEHQVLFAMVAILLPALYYELRLVAIAVSTEHECRRREATEPVGANTWGKTKFGIQGLAVFVIFGLPWPILGFCLAMSLMALTLPLAHLSLRGHQLDLEAIRLKPMI